MALRATFKDTTFHVGDTVEIFQKIKIKEGNKARTQAFKGVVISIKGHGVNKSFTVRRIAVGGIGVERIWSLASPWISKVKVVKRGKVRRAKLYYLRKRVGRQAIRVKTTSIKVEKVSVVDKTMADSERAEKGEKQEEESEKKKSRKARRKSSSKVPSG